ncbi:6709_t:CDS:1, partial [Cetraspora pellucida]
MPKTFLLYMPNTEAICKQISHVKHKDLLSQLQLLKDFDVLALLYTTVQEERFFVKEIEFDNKNIIIFYTTNNLQYLEEA